MVLAALLGGPLGASAGILAGSVIASRIVGRKQPTPFFQECDQSADNDSTIPYPQTGDQPVNFFKQRLLRDTSPALVQPDYDRALFINKILQLLWPHLSPAIHKEVMKQAKAPIDEALAKIGPVETIRIDKLDLGERPFRVDSFKTFMTSEDEIIIETPLFWGGDLAVRATVVLKAGSTLVDVPIDVANIMFKALARITIKPLVETLPCVGGITISLLEEPIVDVDVRLCDSPDIMALPGIPLAVKTAIKLVIGKMMLYPNEFTLPLMEGFGLPPPPMGMLHVKVVSGHGIKSGFIDKVDPFVVLEIREGRAVQTATIDNDTDPVWNEDLDLVVDDPVKQQLKVMVMDDDLVSADVVGGATVELSTADFMNAPGTPITLRLPVYHPGEGGALPMANADDLAQAVATAASDAAVAAAVAAVPKKRGLIGKLKHKKEAKKAAAAILQSNTAAPASSMGSSPAVTPRADSTAQGAPGSEAGTDAGLVRQERPPPGSVVGSVTLELTFFPFKAAQSEATPAEEPAPAATSADAATAGKELVRSKSSLRSPAAVKSVRKILLEQSFADPNPKQKGVLTVDLKKVMKLAESCDSYVVLRLYDPHRLPVPDVEVKTKVELNESSPRYNFKTDFVNISASSVLTLTVYSQPGLFASITSLKVPLLQKADAKILGKIRVPLDAVVKEGRVKDVYPLQEAQTGEMHLTMEWAGIDLGDDDDAAAVQARTASDAALFAVPEGPEGDSAPVVAAVQAVEAAAEATPATGTVGVSGQ